MHHKLVADVICDIQNGKMKLPCNGLMYAIYLYYDDWDGFANESWNLEVFFHDQLLGLNIQVLFL